MMNTRFGDIPLEHYRRIIRPRSPWHRLRTALLAGACIMAFCAGSLAPWAGKNSDQLTLTECLELVDARPDVEWEQELAVKTALDHVVDALEKLKQVAKRGPSDTGKSVEYATLALRHAAVSSITGLKEVQAGGLQPKDKMDEYLQKVEKALRE
jgi:hypothetical protein